MAINRQINWAGYIWNVYSGSWGGNNYSDSTDNVFVDSQGNLHLKITNRNGIWYSAEIDSVNAVGNGIYTVGVVTDPSVFAQSVVVGLFYYNNSNTDELDMEFSRWNDPNLYPNVQYTVWQAGASPTESPYIKVNVQNTSNKMIWDSNNIYFETKDNTGVVSGSWKYPGTYIPKTGGQYCFDLWLYKGQPPSDGKEQELILSSFKYDTSTPSTLSSITITSTSANINIGSAQQLAATCKDQNNNVMTCPTITWSSSDTSVAIVSSSGVVTGVSVGTINIIASSGTVVSNTSIITVTIATVLSSIQILPTSATIKIGRTKQLTATCKDQSGNSMTCPGMKWTSSNPSMATVSSTGLVKGIVKGNTNITASYGTIMSNISIISVTRSGN